MKNQIPNQFLSTVAGSALLVALLCGCEMQESAKRAADSSERAADAGETIIDTATLAYLDGRTAGARDRRQKELDEMEKQREISPKFGPAGSYFASFEFQLWKEKGIKWDSAEKREVLYKDALDEFFNTLQRYSSVDPGVAITSKSPAGIVSPLFNAALEKLNFMALAFMVHKIFSGQIDAGAQYHFEPVSILSLIMTALEHKNDTSALPLYYNTVINEEENAIYLMQIRQSMYGMSALRLIWNQEGIDEVMRGHATSWRANFATLDHPIKVSRAIDFIKGTFQMVKFLKPRGKSTWDPNVLALYSKLDVDSDLIAAPSTPLERSRNELLGLIKLMKASL